MDAKLRAEIVAHHLRIFGVSDPGLLPDGNGSAKLSLLAMASTADVAGARASVAAGHVVVALLPQPAFCAAFGVESSPAPAAPPFEVAHLAEPDSAWRRLRTLQPVRVFRHPQSTAVVATDDGAACWLWVPAGQAGVLMVGTDLAGDLIRYRQGDPEAANHRPTEAMWDIAGERPNYLFERQLEGRNPSERQADWWAMALARTLADKLGRPLAPLLPAGAPGAVIVTGDDDQAFLEKYDEQLRLLGDTPITYFLHSQTRHTRPTLRKMFGRRRVDLGLHPDALEAPGRYGALFDEQAEWYRGLVGDRPLSVRNHGFLNDGYWGHLPAWLRGGVRISSNLPGLDGRVLNGSLLPARLAHDGGLTPHWSLLTVVGDGVRYALRMNEAESADCIRRVADDIRASGLPGVMVLNLHPQNVGDTRAMHHAAMEVIRSGFVAWTMRDCLEWFEQRDTGVPARAAPGALERVWRRVRSTLTS